IVAGIGSERPDPFDIPAYSASLSAFEGRAFARYLSCLNQIEAPGFGPGNGSDERSQRISDHFQWRDELFADPASGEIIGTDARIETA
ncbi:hypothetical protein, partial [Proteus mirabilis]|uniref:hypothetical protein n=1 Tax=Proteus mirabilis TaxID=584 RepID=UPI001954EC45